MRNRWIMVFLVVGFVFIMLAGCATTDSSREPQKEEPYKSQRY